jgi:hypothetical protein
MKQLNEIKRLQQLAGINEIKINKPNIKNKYIINKNGSYVINNDNIIKYLLTIFSQEEVDDFINNEDNPLLDLNNELRYKTDNDLSILTNDEIEEKAEYYLRNYRGEDMEGNDTIYSNWDDENYSISKVNNDDNEDNEVVLNIGGKEYEGFLDYDDDDEYNLYTSEGVSIYDVYKEDIEFIIKNIGSDNVINIFKKDNWIHIKNPNI